ncbi:MAG: MarR family transcriptional regulator [Pseudomonadota bacterium]
MTTAKTEAPSLAEHPADAFDPLKLDLQLCFALYTASNLVTRLYWPLLKPLGVTYLQYIALLALWEQSPQTVGELGKRLELDSGTLTPLFKRLEALELVTRARDPEDERRVIIDLTDKARALRAEALAVPPSVFSKLPMPVEDMVRLKALLGQLIDGLKTGES